VMGSLAITLMHEGHYAEAEKLLRETADSQRRVLGPAHGGTLCPRNFGDRHLSRGTVRRRIKIFEEAIRTATAADQPYNLSVVWIGFADGAAIAGRRDEALQYLDQAIDHGYGPPDSIAGAPI
jgi:hypothetical protein